MTAAAAVPPRVDLRRQRPAVPLPEVEQVAAGGVRFAVRRGGAAGAGAGAGEEPSALLLHGVPQTSAMWGALLAELAVDREVVAPDLPGLGGSERLTVTSAATVADALAALVTAVSERPVDVVGHDWGGVVALALAGRRPELVRRLVVLDAPYRVLDPLRAFHVPLSALPVLPELLVTPRSVRWGVRHGWRAPGGPPEALLEEAAQAYASSRSQVGAVLAYYRSASRSAWSLSGPRGLDLPDVAPQRTLVGWGAEDPVLPLRVGEAVVRDVQRGVLAAGGDPSSVSMLTVPGAGHFVVDEAPEVVVPAVAAFFRAG